MAKLTFLWVILLLFACSEKNEISETSLLTSKTWGKPEVLYHPESGYYSETSCSETTKFTSNGNYEWTNCKSILIDGKWNWTRKGKEINLKTEYNNIPQKEYIITVIELSNSILHTKVREVSEPEDTLVYWEYLYQPLSN